MTKCKICGKRMKLKAADRYEVRIREQKSALVSAILMAEDTIAECFDCPRCGCQNLMQIRETNVVKGESDDSGRNTESGARQDQGADGGC